MVILKKIMKTLSYTVYLFLITGVIFFQNGALAQVNHKLASVSGTVIDAATKKPLEYISVSLKIMNTPLKATLTKTDGSFAFTNLKPGKYTVAFISVSHELKMVDADISDSTNLNFNLDKVSIDAKTTILKQVVINGNKPLIKQEIDRIVYDLEADPDSKGTNLLTMMRKVPLLSVDGEENVLFKGKDDFKIFINGRPSSMFERNLKEALKSIPASTIQRIEVITNPSSKYDAEGLGGIINIVTSKKIEGYKGSINISERFPTGGPGLGSSISIKRGKFAMSAFGGASLNQTPETLNSNYRRSSGPSESNLIQNGSRKSDGSNGYFGSEMSYQVSKLSLITTQINVNGGDVQTFARQATTLTSQNGVAENNFDAGSETKSHGWDASANYQLGFKSNKNKLLTLSYQYSTNENKLSGDRRSAFAPNLIQSNNGSAAEQTLQVDYVQAFKKVMIEAGIKGILRENKSNSIYQEYNTESASFLLNPITDDIFLNDQNILGAYNSYQFKYKKLEVKAGFRMEQTLIDADFISNSSNVSQNYFNIIPAVSLNRKIDALSTINLGFSQRIKRPGIKRLNPFVDRSNPLFESAGNPDLGPSLINSIQFGYSRIKKTTVNISLDYSFAKDIFLQVTSFDPVTQITRLTFQNTGKASGLTANLYLNYPISKSLNLNINGNGGFNQLEGMNESIPVKVELFTYNVTAFGGYKLNKGWRLNANIGVISRNISALNGQTNGLITSSLGMNKEVIKNKLSFSASATNPFTKYRDNIIETFDPTFTQTSLNRDYFRTFNMSLNYNFGKLKDSVKKSKRSIKNDDL